jgi:hypothetical protein
VLLLHLSDIHFRAGEVGTAMDPNAHLRNELLRDAKEQCERLGKVPEAVLLSGDVAFAGDIAEYEYALSWLNELCAACGTTVASVFTIPGNHDVVRKIASRNVIQSLHRDIKQTGEIALDALLRGLLSEEEGKRLLYESIASYNAFAVQFFCDLLPPDRTIAERKLYFDDGSALHISGLNSTFVSSANDEPGSLFVDPASFGLKREPGVEHLVLCHHPYNWLGNGRALNDFLNDVARIHLFGHEHTNRIEVARDWLRVAASAAHPDRQERGWEPGYNLLELDVTGEGSKRYLDVSVHVRVWQPNPGQFRPKMDRGNVDAFRQRFELEPWTRPSHAEVPAGQTMSAELADPSETAEREKADPMDSLRDISVRFFKLTLSQKSAIAGKLELIEEEDANQPDFERFRRIFIRARQRDKVEQLDAEVRAVQQAKI